MIDAMWMLGIAGAAIAAIFAVLLTVLGWLGNKLYSKVDEISKTMHQIAAGLHEKINDHDRRLSHLEAGCEVRHKRRVDD